MVHIYVYGKLVYVGVDVDGNIHIIIEKKNSERWVRILRMFTNRSVKATFSFKPID